MNLVHEQHAARVQIGEDAHEVALALQRRSGGADQRPSHFVGDDVGQSGLSETGRSVQQGMFEWLGALAGCFDRNAEVLDDVTLSSVAVFLERLRTKIGQKRSFL